MNILLLAANEKLLEGLPALLGRTPEPITKLVKVGKGNLVEGIQIVEDLWRQKPEKINLYSAVGGLLGRLATSMGTPQILIDLGETTQLLPTNAFFVFHEILVMVGDDPAHWKFLKRDGQGVSIEDHIGGLNEDGSVGEFLSRQLTNESRVEYGVEKTFESRTADYILSIRTNASTTRVAATQESATEALREMAYMLAKFNTVKEPLWFCKNYNGWGWNRTVRAQVYLSTTTGGTYKGLDNSVVKTLMLELFGPLREIRMMQLLKEAIGCSTVVTPEVSADLTGGSYRLYIAHEGVVMVLEPIY